MGYRSTFTSTLPSSPWPKWFEGKWRYVLPSLDPSDDISIISNANPGKMYDQFAELLDDIKQAVQEMDEPELHFVVLHEDGEFERFVFGSGSWLETIHNDTQASKCDGKRV